MAHSALRKLRQCMTRCGTWAARGRMHAWDTLTRFFFWFGGTSLSGIGSRVRHGVFVFVESVGPRKVPATFSDLSAALPLSYVKFIQKKIGTDMRQSTSQGFRRSMESRSIRTRLIVGSGGFVFLPPPHSLSRPRSSSVARTRHRSTRARRPPALLRGHQRLSFDRSPLSPTAMAASDATRS